MHRTELKTHDDVGKINPENLDQWIQTYSKAEPDTVTDIVIC